jgi:plasmid stabilization system protein ParE
VADFRLAAPADAQLGDILAWSGRQFGEPAQRRYAALLAGAMQDVADNPRRPAIVWHPVSGQRLGVYRPPGPAGEPRHYLVLRVGADGVVEILGFIPDGDLQRRALQRVLRAGASTP